MVLHIYDVQRGTGSLVEPTSVWRVACVSPLGMEPSKVELDGVHLLQGIRGGSDPPPAEREETPHVIL